MGRALVFVRRTAAVVVLAYVVYGVAVVGGWFWRQSPLVTVFLASVLLWAVTAFIASNERHNRECDGC